LLRFYSCNDVTALLSLSVSEGLPVSMIEAHSYGIPVVACEVGGVPEIVNEQTGILIDSDATVSQMATAIKAALEPGRFDPSAVRAFFREHYEATTNYNQFADALIALHEGQDKHIGT
jgi:glycosyltransferase involved in cell wall biosynthesis